MSINEEKFQELEIRRLGRTEMKPKSLGLGCGYLGNPKRPDQEAIATIRYAIENSISLFGVCRGMQLIAEYFGSTFKKDCFLDFKTSRKHIGF